MVAHCRADVADLLVSLRQTMLAGGQYRLHLFLRQPAYAWASKIYQPTGCAYEAAWKCPGHLQKPLSAHHKLRQSAQP